MKLRDLQRMTVSAIQAQLAAGSIIITADGSPICQLCALDSQANQQPAQADPCLAASKPAAQAQTTTPTMPAQPIKRPPLYNPACHRPGDRVLVRQGKGLVEMVVPALDAEGNPLPW
jgi:hypothetical protein